MGSTHPAAGDELGPYVIKAEVGTAGMGIVYLAEHKATKQQVSLKLLRPELAASAATVALFLAEPRALQAIAHENVAEVIDIVEGGQAYFVTELVRGQSLSELITGKRLPLNRALHIAAQVCAAVAAAHDVDVVHRNLKPANIIIVPHGNDPDFVKLLDIGVSKMQDLAGGKSAGTLVGTPAYMAPEQFRQQPADDRSDVYAFGVLLYELAVGARPFKAAVPDLIRQHLQDAPPRPSSVVGGDFPPALEQLILHCLEKERDQRPGSMTDILLALAAILDVIGPPAPTLAAVPRTDVSPSMAATVVTAPPTAPIAPAAVERTLVTAPPAESLESTVVAPPPVAPPRAAAPLFALPPPESDDGEAAPRARPPWALLAAGAAALIVLGVVGLKVAGAADETPGPVADVEPAKPDPTDPAVPTEPAEANVPAAAMVDAGTPAAHQADTPPPAAAVDVEIAFRSTPPGASVTIVNAGREQKLGVTPFSSTLPAEPADIVLVFRSDGYKDATRRMRVAPGAVAEVELKKRSGRKKSSEVQKQGDLINPF